MKKPFDLSMFNKGPLTKEQLEEYCGSEILIYAYYGWRTVFVDETGMYITDETKANNKDIQFWFPLPKISSV